MENRNRTYWLIGVFIVLLLCCYCACVAAFGSLLIRRGGDADFRDMEPVRVITRVVTVIVPDRATPTPAADGQRNATPTPAAGSRDAVTPHAPADSRAIATPDAAAAALYASEMPAADPRALTLRLKPGVTDIPLVVNATPPSYEVGAKQQFWVSNVDTMEYRQITAELRYVTEHVAMWVQEGVKINQADLEASADRFEEKTYPTNREFFGSEWTPGVDNDPRLHILHARDLGQTVAGYYSSSDEYPRAVNEYSNEREMFYVAADANGVEPNTSFYDGLLAHEFQHMIHWANDRNEDSWVNEGMSELAFILNGFDAGGMDIAYSQQPDTQLTTWGDPSEGNAEHYGAAYLFMTYFLERFGEDLMKAVVASPKNGIAGFDEALEQAGRPERFEDVFADWVIANYIDASDADPEGRYGYDMIDLFDMSVAKSHRRYPASEAADVNQYGADYIELRTKAGVALTIDFQGDAETPLVADEVSDGYMWWSNRGDQSNSTLTRPVDLRGAVAPKLTFRAWYEIEEGWDYAYVEASTDGGETWQILEGRTTTAENPVANAYGPGWTGASGGGRFGPEWIDEEVDLTPFAGQEILLRFEMVTDDAVNLPGFLLDDIAISEIGYRDDGESGEAGWTSDGWLLIDNTVTQRWLVQLLSLDTRDELVIQRMVVDANGAGQLVLDPPAADGQAVLIISALAPLTTHPAAYEYTIH